MRFLAHAAALVSLWSGVATHTVVRQGGGHAVIAGTTGLRDAAAQVAAHRRAGPAYSNFFLTGYDDYGTTATGTPARWGEVAVDPSVVPLGAYVQIKGLGIFHAEDTGGLIHGYRLDVWFPTAGQCYAVTGWWPARWSRNRADLG